MTVKEALSAVLQVSVSDNTLDKALLDNGLGGADAYDASKSTSVDLAAIDVLSGLLSTPDVSEGGYSVRYDRSAIQSKLAALKQKHDITTGPVIRDASNKW